MCSILFFQLILLTNRELQEAVIKNHPGIKLIHSSEKRTNESISKQIACVWMDEDGAPPEFSGVWLDGASGNFREIEGYKPNPNIEPACFSLLFPKGSRQKLILFFEIYL